MLNNESVLKAKDAFSLNNDFMVEFFAYSFTTSNTLKKVYIKVQPDKKTNIKKIAVDDEKLNLISRALNNNFLSSFVSDRYSLYDISLRESDLTRSVGFSFNDVKDFVYMEPTQAFKPFENFGVEQIIYYTNKIENCMFHQQPQYNPISMIGLVFDDVVIKCIKAYIRYDLSDAPTLIERGYILENIIKTINPQNPAVKLFSELAQKLECLGFVFYFVGIDCYAIGVERFKLYFRFLGEINLNKVEKEITLIFSQFGFCNGIEKTFQKHKNGIWGLAISTDKFEYVNGIQLYFYP